jgi:hypothetical protein
MNKAELIFNIKVEREKLQGVLDRIALEDMTIPGVTGEWSAKDVLAHLAAWCSRAVTLLFQAERGVKLQRPQSNAPDWADVNAKDYASQRDRSLDRILADFHGSHAQLIRRLEAWADEAALFDAKRYPALNGYSLADHVWGDSGEHDAEHCAQIVDWHEKTRKNRE